MERHIAARPTPDFPARRRAAGEIDRSARRTSPEERRARRNRLASRLVVVASAWSLGLLIAASALPVYNGESISNSAGVTFTSTTLVGSQGAWVLIPTAIPLLLCGFVWLALRRKRADGNQLAARLAWVAIGLLGLFALLSILSIGGFVIPTILLLARATALSTPPAPSPAAVEPTAPAPARREHLW